MFHQRGRYERSFGVEAELIEGPVLEYTADENEIIIGKQARPIIIEHLISKKDCDLNIMDGYDRTGENDFINHSIYHLYEFESKTKFLDEIPRNLLESFTEIKTRFLCCRYVICAIDDWMVKHKDAEILAIRTDGNIYIGLNKSSENIFPNEAAKEAAFGGCNFAKKVTVDQYPSSSCKHHCVVKQWHVRNKLTHKSMTIYMACVARAFDSDGNIIEIKTIRDDVVGKLQNLKGNKARDWWLRALLSGSNRIVYGLRQEDYKINEIYEASLDDFTNGHFQFNESRLFTKVFKIFEIVSRTLLVDGSICSVTLKNHESVSIRLETKDYLKRSSFW